MSSSTDLTIPGYGPLPFIDFNPKNFFRRTNILFGPSESGKSFVLFWMVDKIAHLCPNVIVICPTNESEGATYTGIAPKPCIYKDITVQTLYDIWDRQKESTRSYYRANKHETLKSLFLKAGDQRAIDLTRRIENIRNDKVALINNNHMLNDVQKHEQIESIRKKVISVLAKVYKKTIRQYAAQLGKEQLTDEERFSLKYRDFNPSLLLIMDDCASQIEKWGKDPIINQIFFEGRHNFVTSFYTMQDDVKLSPGIRMNVFNAIFTSQQVAMKFFTNKSNSFTTTEKRNAQVICDWLFKTTDGVENNKKFVFCRNDKTAKFRYVLADDVKHRLHLGCKSLWALCEKLPETEQTENNKFSKSFVA